MLYSWAEAPKKIPMYWNKFGYIRLMQRGMCEIAKSKGISYDDPRSKVEDLHHTWIHNTANNRKKFPLLIHSLWNLTGVNNQLHLNNGSWGKMSLVEVGCRENFLRRHPCVAHALNFCDMSKYL